MKTKKQQKIKDQILNTIPIFLAKTYKIVDNPEYKDIISWTEDGQGFVVKDINKLTTQIFPKHFKHSNFASFVRQLNMYGFHKIKSEEDGHAFTHEAFQKDEIEKLQQIKRKNGSTSDPQNPNQTNMMIPLRRHQQTEFQKQLNNIKNKHEDLQSFVSMLVDQNKEILMQNRNFVTKMSKMQEKYRNKLQTLMLLLLFGKAKNSNGQPFILPQQFQNMLESFSQTANTVPDLNEQGIRKKKPKRQEPLMMIKNQSQADIQLKNKLPVKPAPSYGQKQDELDHLIDFMDGSGEKKVLQRPKDELDEALELIPASPNHSYISFPDFYEKESRNEVSQFLDRLQYSDCDDLSVIDQKNETG